jgi:hypothetical protein
MFAHKGDAMPCRSDADPVRVALTVFDSAVWRFFALLRKGFCLETTLPGDLETLLRDRLSIPAEYLAQRVQTVFLDGRAVDDMARVQATDGSVVALSAAMPGLVGATLRKGGQLNVLRRSISSRDGTGDGREAAPGWVTVKLFNLVCDELGRDVLHRGILLPPGDFQDFLAERWGALAPACRTAAVNGEPREPGSLAAAIAQNRAVALLVRTTA